VNLLIRRGDGISLGVMFAAFILAGIAFQNRVLGGDLSFLLYPDERNYYYAGAELLGEHGWRYFLLERSLWNAPLNIVWVWVWGQQVEIIRYANLVLIGFSGLMLWEIARQISGRAAAYFALCIFLFHVPILRYSGTLLSEPLFIFLLVLSLRLLVFPGRYSGVACGLTLGLATLTRPTPWLIPLWLVLLLCFFLLPYLKVSSETKSYLTRVTFKVCLGFLIVVSPYLLKNYLVFDRLEIATGSGAVLYLGTDLRTDGDEPIYSGRKFDTNKITAPHTHLSIEGDRRLKEAALEQIKEKPLEVFLLTLRKPFRYLFGSTNSYFFPEINLVSFVQSQGVLAGMTRLYNLGLLTFAVVFGIVGLCLPGSPVALRFLSLAIISYFCAVHAVLFPIPRLALPLYPIFVLYSSFALFQLWDQKRWPVLAGSFGLVLGISAYLAA